jgi:hypothetical protein
VYDIRIKSRRKKDASDSTHQGVHVPFGGEDRRSIAASTLVVSASPWVPHKRVDAGLSANRFAGRTVTIALPGAIKTDIGLFKEDWERQTGARLKVIASD